MDFVKLETAADLRDFLNGIPMKDLRVTYLETREGDPIKGIRIRVNALTDGSETVDYAFV